MVTLNTEVLRPLRRLERIELRNEYWQCNPDFMAVEQWITSRGIAYEKQCKKFPKMSEKIISQVTVERKDVNLDNVWNITVPFNGTKVAPTRTKTMTPFEKFDKEFSALQAFIIGLEVGLTIGIVFTYLWLRRCCKWKCRRPQSRRERRRRARLDADMRTNLLWTTIIHPDLETPPSYRRELILPDRSTPYGIPEVTEARLQVDAIRLPDRAETPPPPYNECRISL